MNAHESCSYSRFRMSSRFPLSPPETGPDGAAEAFFRSADTESSRFSANAIISRTDPTCSLSNS
jgi:hypothetical protein